MSDLKSIIPAEFFKPQAKLRSAEHGKIFVSGGRIAVGWGKKCPTFNENLEAARKLKSLGLGTYDPNSKVWVFAVKAAHTIIAEFPTLELHPEVEVLAKVSSLAPQTPNDDREIHGKIELDGDQWTVSWPKHCSLFSTYLAHARRIREKHRFSQGWNAAKGCWKFSRLAAADIISSFPEKNFSHPAALREDATKNSVSENLPAGNDPYADRLAKVAEAVLG